MNTITVTQVLFENTNIYSKRIFCFISNKHSCFQKSTRSELQDFLQQYRLEDVQIVFKNEIEKDIVRVSFAFKTLDGTVQKNVFRYKTDPADQRRLLYQVCLRQNVNLNLFASF